MGLNSKQKEILLSDEYNGAKNNEEANKTAEKPSNGIL
jgi:hypothetical protein